MLKVRAIVAVALGGAILAGCGKSEDKTPAATSTGQTPTQGSAEPGNAAPQTAGSPETPAATSDGSGPVHPTQLPSIPVDAPPVTTITPSSGQESADPRKLLTAIAVDTADKKWDAAEANFKKLDAMQLPSELKDAVTQAHEKFVAARTASQNAPSGTGSPTTAATNEAPNK